MVRRHSLQHALARRWMAFAAVLSLSFAASALLLLFLLEDSFIDRHLRAVGVTVVDVAGASATLPAGFQALPVPALPEDIAARIAGKKPGTVIEFRRDDGRYVHVLSARTATGQPFALVYDVTGELTVNPRLPGGLAYALALLSLSLLCAYLLAWAFVVRTARRARALLGEVLASPDPRSLEALAQREPVREFAELLRLHAGVWREQQAAVERERETLAFLAHELRTPLQSARTSMALLDGAPVHAPALARLQRAVQRLTRASNAILWLAGDAAIPAGNTQAAVHLPALAEEFRPLALARGQSIELRVAPGLCWEAPWEAIEVLLGNLLLNAIQHGGEGVIGIDAGLEVLTVRNPVEAPASAGFGLGLRIVQRLAARLGWQVALLQQEGGACCEVRWPPCRASN